MFQAELGAMVRREQFHDYVREAERREAKKREPRNEEPARLARILVVAPLCLAAARMLLYYVLQV